MEFGLDDAESQNGTRVGLVRQRNTEGGANTYQERKAVPPHRVATMHSIIVATKPIEGQETSKGRFGLVEES